eukprot:scaffold57989_cov44-Cyclotella_meneghiniana.AAC.1
MTEDFTDEVSKTLEPISEWIDSVNEYWQSKLASDKSTVKSENDTTYYTRTTAFTENKTVMTEDSTDEVSKTLAPISEWIDSVNEYWQSKLGKVTDKSTAQSQTGEWIDSRVTEDSVSVKSTKESEKGEWIDSVNKYWQSKLGTISDKSMVKSENEMLTSSHSDGVQNKTNEVNHEVVDRLVSFWKAQAEAVSSNPVTMKKKFNEFLESLKFALAEENDEASVFSLNNLNRLFGGDDDSTMGANLNVEVMLATSTETETKGEC